MPEVIPKKNTNIYNFRVPPHNIEAERSVLGGILIDPQALLKVFEIIAPDDFYQESHKIIYRAIIELFENNEPYDLIKLHDHLLKKGIIQNVGGVAYLAELSEAVPIASNVHHYAHIVKNKSVLRRLIDASTSIASSCYDELDDVNEVLEKSEKLIYEISQTQIDQNYVDIRSILKDTVKDLEKLYSKKELITGVPTGFTDLDNITAGLQRSDLIIVAGRPSMGKTAFALNIAQNTAIRHNIPVAVFSLEMPRRQLAMRMLSSEAKIDAQGLRTGFITEHDFMKIVEAANSMSKARLFIDDKPAQTVLEIKAKARRLKMEHNIGLVIIDYLQLMRGSRGFGESREREISEISRSLKAMAKELDIPVIALSQLNRKVEDRPGSKRPQMSDIRESGAIEQDADVIAFIYRDEVYNKAEDNPNRGKAEIIIEKQRNGPTGVVTLTFVKKYSLFGNYTQQYQPAEMGG